MLATYLYQHCTFRVTGHQCTKPKSILDLAIVLPVMIARLSSLQISCMLQCLLTFHPACQDNLVSCSILHLHASMHSSACGLPHGMHVLLPAVYVCLNRAGNQLL